ncbi:DUF1415 domain-containing protein [Paraburkholderia mimosarum]|uniref:DUF1415 domain-containing protein n=1 Tax=Paraburkholderia mimosarum TaxID=312026 RepID=UPI0003F7182F|nr:DUF1415 domain-containing protein [Paraburkholderia mimosarum]
MNETAAPSPAARSSDHAAILEATRHWLTRAVIGLNLCPFAKSVHVKNQIRYVISEATELEGVLTDLERELRTLAEADPAEIDTTLLILPHALADFADFNDATWFAERLVQQLRLEGTLQVASFHPDYQFDGTAPDDIENYTNRAPYPILHLLREASIERAVEAFPDAADIYERNQETLRKLGLDGWREWMSKRD